MPLESKWADAPDEEPERNVNESFRGKERSPRVSRPHSKAGKFNNKHHHDSDKSVNMMGGHQIGFATPSEKSPKGSRSASPTKNRNNTPSRPATSSSSLEGRIIPNFTDERELLSSSGTLKDDDTPSKMGTSSPSKLELLKKKIEEQRGILEKTKHKEQQQKLLDDFLNDDSMTLNWAEDDEDDDKLLERINKLKV